MAFPSASSAQPQKGVAPVSAKRGVLLFEAICAKTLPNFGRARSNAKANGITWKADTGTIFSTSENLSVKVQDGPGDGKSCSIVFQSKSSKSAFLKEASKIATGEKLQKTLLGTAGLYQAKAMFLVSGPTRFEGNKYYSLKMLSQR